MRKISMIIGLVLLSWVLGGAALAEKIDPMFTADSARAVSTYAENTILGEARQAIASKNDVSADLVIQYALGSLTEVSDYSAGEIKKLRAEAHFIYHENFCFGYEPVWLIYIFDREDLVYKALYGYDGSYMEIAPADIDFTHTIRKGFYAEEELGVNFMSLGFWEMTLEEKAEFSKIWNPIIDAYAASHPYYVNQHDRLFNVTRHIYGLPGQNDVPQKEALAKAQTEIVSLGADASTATKRKWECYFDVTNPDHPQWKFVFFHVGRMDRPKGTDGKNADHLSMRYRVVIDGQTNDVLESFVITNEMDLLDYRL